MTNINYIHSEVWDEELILQRQLEIDYALDNAQQTIQSIERRDKDINQTNLINEHHSLPYPSYNHLEHELSKKIWANWRGFE